MKKIIFALLVIMFYSPQIFASTVTAKIEYLLPHPGDVVFFNMVGSNMTSLNAQGTNNDCITVDVGHFRLDISTETGAAIYAALLSAQAQDKLIQIVGTNSCSFDRENVSWVLLR